MNRARVMALLGLLLVAGAWSFFKCGVNQNINFLMPGGGSWIIYPTPPSVPMLNTVPMTTIFRREFTLPKTPSAATVFLRCFKAGQLSLNGKNVAAIFPVHWKKTTSFDVSSYLHAGTNELVVRVDCDNGLPALSLALETDIFALESDEHWTSSLEGAVWQPAGLASHLIEPAPGNGLYGAANMRSALRTCWPLVLVFAVAAALAVYFRWNWFFSGKGFAVALGALGLVWALLLLHNFPLLPVMIGFDAQDHLTYIEYIQAHGSLPSAGEGWEFFQAPLYYLIGADLLSLLHLQALEPEAGQVLGILNLLMGAAELGLILAGLRMLFPARPRLQIAGLLLAAFLPLQLYLLHYPTNETMGAVTTTAVLFLCLKILRQTQSPMSWHVGLGVLLGMALLSKASAVIALAAVFFALGVKAWWERKAPSAFLREAGVVLGLCLLIGGWHYWKLWREFGNPLAGNWDSAVGGGWWQLPGYRTTGYYFSFGRSLVQPFFSGFHSFWDSLYSTFWADGLMGGQSILYGCPPWNYNLMVIACALALVPSVLFLTGLVRALNQGLRQRRVDLLFLAIVPLLFCFAIFSMSLKLPFYSQCKALYGLPAILPFCVLSVMGLEFWMARLGRARAALLLCLGVWLLAVYGSFWIRPGTVQTGVAAAMGLYKLPGQDPGPALNRVLAADPRNPEAIVSMAALERASGHLAQAVTRLEMAAAAASKTNAMIDTSLARCLGEEGRTAEALDWAARACSLTVDYPSAPSVLCSLALGAGQDERAAQAASWALRLKPQDGSIHFEDGLALDRLHRHEEALEQMEEAVRLAPQNAQWKAKLEEMRKERPARP